MEYADGGRRQGSHDLVEATIMGGHKMKRIMFSCVAAVFLSPGPAGAELTVYEYIPGEKVTLDDVTGYYWYWNLPDFCNMTYDEQTAAISDLGTYGYISGGWHMAEADELLTLWDSFCDDEIPFKIMIQIPPHNIDPGEVDPEDINICWGRLNAGFEEGTHYTCWLAQDDKTGLIFRSGFPGPAVDDSVRWDDLGAWVVTQHPIVPEPAAIILAVTGLLSLLGLKRLRRKHQE